MKWGERSPRNADKACGNQSPRALQRDALLPPGRRRAGSNPPRSTTLLRVCVKSRQPTITPVQTAHHSAIPGHLSLISMLTGRKINGDVKHEKILGDAEAAKLLSRPYRAPWQLA